MTFRLQESYLLSQKSILCGNPVVWIHPSEVLQFTGERGATTFVTLNAMFNEKGNCSGVISSIWVLFWCDIFWCDIGFFSIVIREYTSTSAIHTLLIY